jgi:hypothetical protein
MNSTRTLFDNPIWSDMLKKGLPYGRFKTFQDINIWIGDLEEKTRKAWSIERIRFEWKKRVDYIANWMETK